MNDWKPGQVVAVDYADGSGNIAIVRKRGRFGLEFAYASGGYDAAGDAGDDATYRLLAVVDPESRVDIERLRDLYDREVIVQNGDPDPRDVTPAARGNALQAALREYATPTPPKPDEPTGLGAVVEDTDEVRWLCNRFDHGIEWKTPWWSADLSEWRDYADIQVVRVLSEGVTP